MFERLRPNAPAPATELVALKRQLEGIYAQAPSLRPQPDMHDYQLTYPPAVALEVDRYAHIPGSGELLAESIGDFENAGYYFHFGFCSYRCRYCFHYELKVSRNRELIERYVDALIVEMKRFAGMKADLRNVLYFLGGGTPTAVPADLLRRFLTALRTTLGEPPPMSTVEAKPVTATEEKLQAFYDAGFRRVNFGVQTLDPELYAFHHQGEDLAESFRAIERARRVGFEFINIDIMTGLETQTLASWETTLTTLERLATTGEIDSVFIYPFHDDPRSRTFERPQSTPDPLETTLSEVLARRMFQRLGWRELGSRFFRSARHVRRELLEWAIVRINPSYGEILYHGFGNSSFSVGDRAAYINRRDVRAYCDQIDGGKLGISHYKRLDDAQRATRDLTFDLLYSPVCRTRAIRNKYGAASMDDHDARLDRWAELGLGQRERVLGVWRLSDLGKLVHLQMIPQMYLPKDRRPFAERMLLRKQLGKRYRGY